MRYIDADALEKSIVELPYGYRGMIKNIIAEQPTADVRENKKGKWIKIRPDKRGYTYQFECSNCHFYTYTHNLETDIDYDFCPNCGARMVE